MATMPCSGSSTSPMPVMMSECSRSATASIASRRRRMRSVRKSLGSSTAERIRLPWCLSSFASKRSKSVKASAVPPAKPARIWSWCRRRTFFAPALTTTLPSVTCPSPPSATLAPRRTERLVVPWNSADMKSRPLIWRPMAWNSTLDRHEKPFNAIVEQTEQILRFRRAAHREGQHHFRNARALGKEFDRPHVLIRRVNHRFRAVALRPLDQFGEMRRRRRNAGLRLERAHFPHAEPPDHVRVILVVDDQRYILKRLRFGFPALGRRLPAFAKRLQAFPVELGVHRVELREAGGENIGDLGDVARVEMDMWISGRMHVAERAVDHLRDLDLGDVLRGFEIAGRAGLDTIVARLR